MGLEMNSPAQTKEKLERAALNLFLRQGVDGTSMRDLVKQAGFSLGAFYNHFENKEELAWALFSDAWYSMGIEMRRRVRAESDFYAQLRAVTDFMFELYDQDPDLIGYAFLTRHRYIMRVNVRLPNPHIVVRVFMATAISRGIARKMDVEVATQFVMGAVIQMIDARLLGLVKGSLKSRSKEVADTLYRALKA
jgi:AcrR family transcriptional regulator